MRCGSAGIVEGKPRPTQVEKMGLRTSDEVRYNSPPAENDNEIK
jgi:hypothetical protein